MFLKEQTAKILNVFYKVYMIEGFLLLFFVATIFFVYRSVHLQIELAETKIRLEQAEEKQKFVGNAEEVMKNSFKVLAADTLHSQQAAISDVVKPLKESLEKVDSKIQELEKSRIGAYASITETLKHLNSSHTALFQETSKLSRSLRASNARGQWGEMQLRRVVELAGMVEYCDFVTQHTVQQSDVRHRPDLIIKLPNDRVLVVDAKAPLQAYLEAIEARDEEQKNIKLKEHAKQVKKHLQDLSEKGYWESFSESPEFVVLFLPGESIYAAALEADPQLLEFGPQKRVLMATPTTLIALLKAVSLGWREQVMRQESQKIAELGRTLHERLATMTDHFIRLKRAIDSTVEAYNKAVGSLESRVLPSCRRFEELGVTSGQVIPDLEPIEKITK